MNNSGVAGIEDVGMNLPVRALRGSGAGSARKTPAAPRRDTNQVSPMARQIAAAKMKTKDDVQLALAASSPLVLERLAQSIMNEAGL